MFLLANHCTSTLHRHPHFQDQQQSETRKKTCIRLNRWSADVRGRASFARDRGIARAHWLLPKSAAEWTVGHLNSMLSPPQSYTRAVIHSSISLRNEKLPAHVHPHVGRARPHRSPSGGCANAPHRLLPRPPKPCISHACRHQRHLQPRVHLTHKQRLH